MPLNKHTITIAAPTARVWENLGKFQTWPAWNPFFTKVSNEWTTLPAKVKIDVFWKGKNCPEDLTLTKYDDNAKVWRITAADNFFLKQYIECSAKSTATGATQVDCESSLDGLFGSASNYFIGDTLSQSLNDMLSNLKKKSEA